MNFKFFIQTFLEADFLIPVLYDLISVSTLIILFLFFGLFGYRLYQLQQKERKKDRRESVEEIVFAYLNNEQSHAEIKNYLAENPQYIAVFTEICMELLESLEGDLEHRIKEIFNFDLIRKHFQNKLYSFDIRQIATALFFFKNCGDLDATTIQRIQLLINHEESDIAFAASLALVDSKGMAVQFNALREISKRKDITRIAILELLLIFSDTDEADFDERGKKILQLLKAYSIPLKFRLAFIEAMGAIGFVTQAPALFNFLISYLKKSEKLDVKVVSALIEALGKMNYPSVLPVIKKLVETGNKWICISCAKSLGSMGGEKSIMMLDNLFDHSENEVRQEAMNQLLKIGEPVLDNLPDVGKKDYPMIEKNTLQEITEIKNYQYV